MRSPSPYDTPPVDLITFPLTRFIELSIVFSKNISAKLAPVDKEMFKTSSIIFLFKISHQTFLC